MPATEWKPASQLELGRMLAENDEGSRLPLIPVGGRTSLHFGGAVAAEAILVATTDLNRVVDYPARDMTITVEAGIKVDELHQILLKENQRLPIDIPQARRATIGGAIASNASGPGRFGYGTFRDYVIGMSAVDGRGRLFSSGGRVVKNVAGYDLCKLLTGSLGTLAIISQVTLKLKPTVEQRQLALIPVVTAQRLEEMLVGLNTSATRPVAIEILNPKAVSQIRREAKMDLLLDHWLLCIGYEGSQVESDWQIQAVLSELKPLLEKPHLLLTDDSADRFWNALTEYQTASDDPLTFRVSVLPSRTIVVMEEAFRLGIAMQAHAGNGVLIGHLPDRCSSPAAALDVLGILRSVIDAAGGSFQLVNCDADWKPQLLEVSTALPELELHRGIKMALDPGNVLSPGRLW